MVGKCEELRRNEKKNKGKMYKTYNIYHKQTTCSSEIAIEMKESTQSRIKFNGK